jgi:nucleotide-binding universal stress UspA family protein
MFDVVVVGADDSQTARKAVDTAARLVKMSGGKLHIVTAFGSKPRVEGPHSWEYKYTYTEGEIDALLQVLSFVAKGQGVEPSLHAVKGDPADALVSKASELGADLVVVGNRGMQGVRRVLGSVPNSVAHGAPCSVLIVDTSE